jgi:hypothetical protein
VSAESLAAKIRDVPDFPKPGIVFKDIMPLLADPATLREAIDLLADWARPRQPDVILGAEARGFIFGGALAYALGCGFVAARKPGKLPWETVETTFELEYGTDTPRPAGDRPGRLARDRRHGEGEDRPRRAARRLRGRSVVRDRADVPGRPLEARRIRRPRPDRVLRRRRASRFASDLPITTEPCTTL